MMTDIMLALATVLLYWAIAAMIAAAITVSVRAYISNRVKNDAEKIAGDSNHYATRAHDNSDSNV
jgi:ABC-type nickel/cobalt efflux system permease component RcnA